MADTARHAHVARFHKWDRRVGGWVGRAKAMAFAVATLVAIGISWLAVAMLSGLAFWAVFVPVAGIGCYCAFQAWHNFTQERAASALVIEEVRRQVAPVDYSLRAASWVRGRIQRGGGGRRR